MGNFEKGFGGAMNFFNAMSNGTMRARRNEAMTDEINNHTIDTCVPGDTGRWETGIKRNGTWIIVEDYNNDENAKIGHKKWVKKIKTNPECKLKDNDMWGLNEEDALIGEEK